MGKSLHLQVPVPCHENWSNMTSENQGRFCMSCQKTVVDFTAMTDYELIQYFKNLKGTTCGRFTEEQLNTKYALESKRRLNWFKYFVTMLIPTLLISARSYSQSITKKKAAVCATPIKKKEKMPIRMGMPAIILPSNEITGKVTNESGEVLAGASIFIKGTKEGLAADKDGFFAFTTEHDFPLVLTVTYVGYEPLEITVEQKQSKYPLKIVLRGLVMEELVVVGYPPISCRSVTGAVYSVTDTTLFNDFKTMIADTLRIFPNKFSPIKIYPNPLRKSSLLTIEMKNKTRGSYTVLVTDISGRHLQMEQFDAHSAEVQKQIRLLQTVTSGTYVVSIVDPNGKRLSSQNVIVMD